MIVADTNVNLYSEDYTLFHSATQKTNVSFIVRETGREVSWILKVSPKHLVCPLVVGRCKIIRIFPLL